MDFGLSQGLIGQHGHAVFLLAAVLEGPIATIIAAALAQVGTLKLACVIPLAILGDVAGDLIVHLVGRFAAGAMPAQLRHRLGIDRHVIAPLVERFRDHGARMLVIGKLTHFAGLPVLFASGVARMPLVPFVLVSLAATVPKVAALVALGWFFGLALAQSGPPVWLIVAGMALSLLALLPFLCKRGTRWT